MDTSHTKSAIVLIKLFFFMIMATSALMSPLNANAQSFDISLSASGNTEPGDSVTITMTITCNDIIRCRLGNYPNPNAGGMITVTGNATPVLFTIPQTISRFGFFTPGQTKSRSVTITLNGAQGDLVTVEAFADGYCRANDSNGPGGSDTREINCEDTETLTLVTTPVTLSSVSSRRTGDKLKVDWSTSSELFNVGFQLWGLAGSDNGNDQSWKKLHGWLIRSGSGNAIEPQSYSITVRIPDAIDELVALGISSVDNDGLEHYYGPFDPDQRYGNLTSLKPIAWNHIRRQADALMASRGYINDRILGYRKPGVTAAGDHLQAADMPVIDMRMADTQIVAEFRAGEAGIYRVKAQDLSNAGVDWRDVANRDIAVIDHRGNPVVRYIAASGSGSGQLRSLGASGEIYFHARSSDNVSGLYSESSVYRLVTDRHHALNAQYQRKRGINAGDSDFYHATIELEEDTQYSLSSATDDPWLDTVVVSHADKTASYAAAIPVDADAMWELGAVLTLNLARGSALSPVDADGDGVQDAEHTVEAVVLSENGAGGLLPLGTEEAVGKGLWTPEFTIPGGTALTLIDGKAVVGGIFRAGSGYRLSEVQVDSVRLAYARPYVARADDDYLSFTAPDDGALAYSVTVPETGRPLVFAYNDSSMLVRLELESHERRTAASGDTQRQVRFAALDGATGSASSIRYWVSGRGGFLKAEGLAVKSIASKSSLITQAAGADLLMVAHPVFMAPALSAYAQFKRTQGFNVAIINYLDIVDVFGGGQPGPAALSEYLIALNAQSPELAHVLLIGGSSYDHTDKLGTGAMTFIPGHYADSAYSSFTVSDTPYVTDANNALFASIGRWPVRSASDLSTLIANSMAWSSTDHTRGSVLAIAEHTVDGEGLDFGAALDTVVTQLPGRLTTNRVYVDDVITAKPGLSLPQALTRAKERITDALRAGPDVVLYNGHGTTSQLSNKGLLKAADIAGINGRGTQLWLPMSCYMTYFESTHVNTLAHQLLFSGRAVGITGAMLLSNQFENIAVGDAVINSTVNHGLSIGDAVKVHKSAQNNPGLNVNLTHLGDPTLRM